MTEGYYNLICVDCNAVCPFVATFPGELLHPAFDDEEVPEAVRQFHEQHKTHRLQELRPAKAHHKP